MYDNFVARYIQPTKQASKNFKCHSIVVVISHIDKDRRLEVPKPLTANLELPLLGNNVRYITQRRRTKHDRRCR